MLGASSNVTSFAKSAQQLSRPASLSYDPPYEVRGTGWTCWTDFEKQSAFGVQFVCWRGSDVLTFRFS